MLLVNGQAVDPVSKGGGTGKGVRETSVSCTAVNPEVKREHAQKMKFQRKT